MLKISMSLAMMIIAGTAADAGPYRTTAADMVTDMPVIAVGCSGGAVASSGSSSRHVRRQGNCNTANEGSSSRNQRKIINRRHFDCHRDVRTHRIGGIKLKHRHVGDNCAIREVRTSS